MADNKEEQVQGERKVLKVVFFGFFLPSTGLKVDEFQIAKAR